MSRFDVGSTEEEDSSAISMIKKRSLQTSRDAFEMCEEMLARQLNRGRAAEPNVPIEGDAATRLIILLLLSDEQRRRLFLQTAAIPEAWPRIRCLFGAPPYSFLHPDDAAGLRAGGFAHARSNMTYDNTRAANAAQFGPGQFRDQHSREYRVVPRNNDDESPIGTEFLTSTSKLVLQVRVKKFTRQKKMELSRSSIFKKQLVFPQPGETIVLQETKSMLAAMGADRPQKTILKIASLFPRALGAMTATVTIAR